MDGFVEQKEVLSIYTLGGYEIEINIGWKKGKGWR